MNAATQSTQGAQITVRRSDERGHANHGWLDSHHTFSFAGYFDPRFMGFGDLRVINEDLVSPGRGFGTHSHRDMEIVSYPVAGGLEHLDSTGSGGVIRSGEVQVMSAGRGITHSEMNGSTEEPVHFLQIWIQPAKLRTEPTYQEKDFGRGPGTTLIVSPEGRDGSLTIGQDVDIHRVLLGEDDATQVSLRRTKAWVQVIKGTLEVNGTSLSPGDGAAVESASTLDLRALSDVEALVFDLRST